MNVARAKKTTASRKDKSLEEIISIYKDHPSIKSIKEQLNGTGVSMPAANEDNIYKILATLNHKTIYHLLNFFVNIIYVAQAKSTSSKDKPLEEIISIYKDHLSIRSTKEQSKGTGFSMPTANEENIYKIIVSLDPKKAAGNDWIPSKVVVKSQQEFYETP